jgi:hypothetical protein
MDVVPAWSVGTEVYTDVSGRILRTWMPAIHAGMTFAVREADSILNQAPKRFG